MANDAEANDEPVPLFRKPKKKHPVAQRGHRRPIDDGADATTSKSEDDILSKIGDVKEVQKVRERRNGLNALECAVGKELAREFEQIAENPFQMRGGGMLKLNSVQKAAITAVEIEHDIKDQFKKETLLRDEHEEMRKYVESHMNGSSNTTDDSEPTKKKFKPQNLDDEILLRAAEQMKRFSSKSSEELLSNQMLVGIPEVDLGISARMTNIIHTEQKKNELLIKKKLPGKSAIQTTVNPDDPAIKKLCR